MSVEKTSQYWTKENAYLFAKWRRISFFRTGSAFVVAIFCVAAQAATTYTYEDGNTTLVATVPAGETDYLDSAKAAELNGGTIAKFRKLGDGRLVITNDTSSFAGHFWIEDGILTSRPVTGVSLSGNDNLTMGKLPSSSAEDEAGCGAIHILDGATFSVDCSGVSSSVAENLRLQNKTTYFEGAGHNNMGALTILEGENNSAGPLGNNFGGYLRMTGAATIRNDINNWMAFSNNRYLYMNGHTLTLEGRSAGIIESLWKAYDFGDVIVKTPGLYCNRSMWFGSAADSNHTMRVKSGAYLRLNGCVEAAYGTLHLEDGAYINLTGSDRTEVMGPSGMSDLNFPTTENTDSRSKNNWMGPVVLDTPGRIKIAQNDFANGRYLQIGGKISGGGLELAPNVRLVMRAHYDINLGDNNVNDFTNGIFAAAGCDVSLLWGNLLPQSGGDLVLSNASLTVKSGLTYTLPGVKCYGRCKFLGTMDNRYSPGYVWDSATNDDLVRGTRQYYTSLEFMRDDGGNCSGCFSTNVIVSALSGLPGIAAYPVDDSATPVRPCITTPTGPKYFKVIDTWNIDVSDVIAGGSLSFPDGELRFGHNANTIAINVECEEKAGGAAARKFRIAEAGSITFAGAYAVNLSGRYSDRWRFEVGGDGRSLYLTYTPAGTAIIFK